MEIAVACENGEVYLISNFKSKLWLSSERMLTTIAALRVNSNIKKEFKHQKDMSLDFLIGIGHFNGAVIMKEGQVVGFHDTEEWVAHIDVGPIEKAGESTQSDYAVIGTMNNCIELLEFKERN